MENEDFWKSYKEERLLNKKNYDQLKNLSLSDMDIKKLAHLKNKKGEYLLETYDIGYLVANLGQEAFSNLENQFRIFQEKKKQQITDQQRQLKIDVDTLQTQEDISPKKKPKLEITVHEFVWAFMSVLEHDREEELFITNALIEFYEHIKEQVKDQPVQWNHATNMLIELMHEQEFTGTNSGSTGVGKLSVKAEKKIRHPKNNIQEKMIKKLGLELPDLVGEDENKLSFFVKSPNADKKTHKNGINQTYFFKPTKQILCLDFNTQAIWAYDAEIQTIKKLIIPQEHSNDPTILDFAIDNKTERIGACLRDYTLCFWETEDGYQFEKVIKTTTLKNLQVKIWCLESCSKWVTTDKTNGLHLWDLEFEEPTILQHVHQMKIMDVIDVVKINAMLSSSLDKMIYVWDLKDFEIRFQIDLKNSFSVHTLKYSYQHDLLFTASYETQIKVWHFDSAIECTNVGILQGHESMVNNIDLIQDTNYLVSADDFGCIKCWNLRNQQCIQTFRFNFEIMVSKLISVSPESFISVSNRIYLFNLTQLDVNNLAKTKATITTTQVARNPKKANPAKNDNNQQQEREIIDFKYSAKNDQMVVATKQDVRILDCLTGKQLRIMVNLTQKDEDLTFFLMEETEKKFYVSDHLGSIQVFGYNSGKLIKQLQSHSREISYMSIDQKNNLLLSCGFDNKVMIQATSKDSIQVLRTLNHPLGQEDILFCKASFYLNHIATATDKAVLIWNYENLRLMGVCYVDDLDIKALYFLEPYPILIVIDFMGAVYIFHLYYSESIQTYSCICKLELDGSSTEYGVLDQPRCMDFSVTHNMQSTNANLLVDNEVIIAFGTKNGYIFMYDVRQFLESEEIGIQPVRDRRLDANANAFRNEDFDGNKYFPSNLESILDADLFSDICSQEDIPLINSTQHQLLLLSRKVHGKESINVIRLLKIQELRAIVTCSTDGFIKISSFTQGELLCSINICNPLPARWEIKYTKNRKRFMKIKRAIQTLREINAQFRNETSFLDNDNKRDVTALFMTQAFDLDYLISKYGEQTHHKTMKQATKEYLRVLSTEVSSKTTLRSLQYRQNRLKEEKKEAQLRIDLERKKEEEKKQEFLKKKSLELIKNGSDNQQSLDDSTKSKVTNPKTKKHQKNKLSIDQATLDQLYYQEQHQQSDRLHEIEIQEQALRKRLEQDQTMDFTHEKTFQLNEALDELKRQQDRQKEHVEKPLQLDKKQSQRLIPTYQQRKMTSTKNWIVHAEEKGASITDNKNEKKAFKEILKKLQLQVNRTRVSASKFGTQDNSQTRNMTLQSMNQSQSHLNADIQNVNKTQTLQISQSQSTLILPELRSPAVITKDIQSEVKKAFETFDNAKHQPRLRSKQQLPSFNNESQIQKNSDINKYQHLTRFFSEKRLKTINDSSHNQRVFSKKKQNFWDQNKSELDQINSIIKDTINTHIVSPKDSSYKDNPFKKNTLNLSSQKNRKHIGLFSPQYKNNNESMFDMTKEFVSNKMKQAMLEKSQKDLSRLGIKKHAISQNIL